MTILNNGITYTAFMTAINANFKFAVDNLNAVSATMLTANDTLWFSKINTSLTDFANDAGVTVRVGSYGMSGNEYRTLLNNQFTLIKAAIPKKTVNIIITGHSFTTYMFIVGPGPQYDLLNRTNSVLTINDKVNISGIISHGGAGWYTTNLVDDIAANNAHMNTDINILVVWIGINSIGGDPGSGAIEYSAVKAYVQTQIINGYDKVIVITATPVGNSLQNVQVIAFNDLIRTDLSLLDHVEYVDTDLDSRLTNLADVNYFEQAFLPHPVQGGYYAAGDLLAAKIESLYS